MTTIETVICPAWCQASDSGLPCNGEHLRMGSSIPCWLDPDCQLQDNGMLTPVVSTMLTADAPPHAVRPAGIHLSLQTPSKFSEVRLTPDEARDLAYQLLDMVQHATGELA